MKLSWATKEIIFRMIEQGFSYSHIAKEVGVTSGCVAMLVHRKKYDAGEKGVKAPRLHANDHGGYPICWAEGCDEPLYLKTKFCKDHQFKPRTDQPLLRLMGRR